MTAPALFDVQPVKPASRTRPGPPRPTLSTEDISTMRAALRAGRAAGWTHHRWRDQHDETWVHIWRRRQACVQKSGQHITVFHAKGVYAGAFHIISVRQAVDLLVAHGVLPAEVSSAYRAGWAAR